MKIMIVFKLDKNGEPLYLHPCEPLQLLWHPCSAHKAYATCSRLCDMSPYRATPDPYLLSFVYVKGELLLVVLPFQLCHASQPQSSPNTSILDPSTDNLQDNLYCACCATRPTSESP